MAALNCYYSILIKFSSGKQLYLLRENKQSPGLEVENFLQCLFFKKTDYCVTSCRVLSYVHDADQKLKENSKMNEYLE